MAIERVPAGRDAHDDDDEALTPTLLGTGALHSIRETDDEPDEPSLWLPLHRSGSRFGGWQRVAVQRRRQLGFRRP